MIKPDLQWRSSLRAGAASVVGWALDLYDLLIILYIAPAIGPLLFPAESKTLQLALVYGSFAVSLFMRPLGSAIFGPFADRRGRKAAMIIAITGVGISTASMGAVPTYAVAGWLAPALFLILRLVQGFFIGGIVASTHTLGTESAGPRHRGLMSGLISSGGAGLGAVAASSVYFVASRLFPGAAFDAWGWRTMFFTGIAVTVFSLFVFRAVEESPLWRQDKARRSDRSDEVGVGIRHVLGLGHRRVALLSLALVFGTAAQYYLTLGFLPGYLGTKLRLSSSQAALLLAVANVIGIFAGIAVGALSDRIGRRRTLLYVGLAGTTILPTCYVLLAGLSTANLVAIALLIVLMSIVSNATGAPVMVFLNERFPTRIRASGTALTWNIGFALGGLMPTAVSGLSPSVDDLTSRVVAFLSVVGVIYFIGAISSTESKGAMDVGPHVAAPGDADVVQRSDVGDSK